MSIEAAALARAEASAGRAIAVEHSPDGRHGVVLVAENHSTDPVAVLCERNGEDWAAGATLEQPGWIATGDAEEAPGAHVLWGQAEAGATRAVVGHGEGEHPVPVQEGLFLFAAWDVPRDADRPPRLIGFPS